MSRGQETWEGLVTRRKGTLVWLCNCASLYLKDVGSGALGRMFLKPHVEFIFPRKTRQKEDTLEGDLCWCLALLLVWVKLSPA